MEIYYSPLRYPGGKTSLLKYLINIVELNGPIKTYIEPFAGGAGAALGLLCNGHVQKVILNDADEVLYFFWDSVLNFTEQLIEKIKKTPINIREWEKQRAILSDSDLRHKASKLDIGFAAFYLNRCNRSGILRPEVGPIGGIRQLSKWKIDARFNKEGLVQRIKRLNLHKDKIKFFNLDAIDFLKNIIPKLHLKIDETLVYLDPPYFQRGPELYRSYYLREQHIELRKFLENELHYRWVLSYDDVPFINELYKNTNKNGVLVNHFANKAKVGKELIITSNNCVIP